MNKGQLSFIYNDSLAVYNGQFSDNAANGFGTLEYKNLKIRTIWEDGTPFSSLGCVTRIDYANGDVFFGKVSKSTLNPVGKCQIIYKKEKTRCRFTQTKFHNSTYLIANKGYLKPQYIPLSGYLIKESETPNFQRYKNLYSYIGTVNFRNGSKIRLDFRINPFSNGIKNSFEVEYFDGRKMEVKDKIISMRNIGFYTGECPTTGDPIEYNEETKEYCRKHIESG